jgi:hypothetical protein
MGAVVFGVAEPHPLSMPGGTLPFMWPMPEHAPG